MRFTIAQLAAVKAALLRSGEAADLDVLAQNVCEAFATAQDDKTRFAVVTTNETGLPLFAYGPYASYKTAAKAMNTGTMLGVRGHVMGMRPVPRASKS